MPGRLARLERILRRIALWPSEEDIDRWDREDNEANTVWLNGRPILIHGFAGFGERVEKDETARMTITPSRLARLERILRRIALWPSEEDIDRWDREDNEANTVWLNGRPILIHGFAGFGERADVDEYDEDEEDDDGEKDDDNA